MSQFGSSVTDTAIQDYAHTQLVWRGPVVEVKKVHVLSGVSDSGAEQPTVNVTVNGVSVTADPLEVRSDQWTGAEAVEGTELNYGDIIEVSVITAGSNGDSDFLTVSMEAEEIPE
jgi:hypothetical protein